MKLWASYLLFVLAAACGRGVHDNPNLVPDAPSEPDASSVPDAPDDPPPSDAPRGPETQALGMNDISMIMPTAFAGVFGRMNGIDGARDLVPRPLYAQLVTSHLDIVHEFDDFMIFAIRFDLCDRVVVGPCPEGADGSLRLVFQPLLPGALGADVGVHAFYTIPAAELGFAVNELRAIARLSQTQSLLSGPLVDLHLPSFAGLPRLNALLNKYATPDRLIRLAMMGQDARSTEPRVAFRALERHDGEMVEMTVATLDATEQVAALKDADPSYAVTPVADTPARITLALSSGSFNAAAPADQRSALDAVVAADNPLLHTSATLQCVACHVSTYLGKHRAQTGGIDLHGLPSFFTTTHDVRVSQGISAANEHSLHAFSWMGSQLAISQRVANETAVVLDEIERRFPAPAP